MHSPLSNLRTAIDIMKQTPYKFTHCRYAFQTATKLYMVVDYFPGGELFFHLKSAGRFNEERAR
jgi:hypothetical protein